MQKNNQTVVTQFTLLGFHDLHMFKIPAFLLLVMVYTATVTGNLLIYALVSTSYHLRSPMYFFLGHLSLCDLLISTNVAPNTLRVILSERTFISTLGCLTQLYVFAATSIIECCLLAVMSYDRYLAICKPLHYTSIMSHSIALYLVTWSWMAGFVLTIIFYSLLLQVHFCGPDIIDHFFCDLAPVLELACSDTTSIQIEVSFVAIVMALFQFLFIIVTYICIFNSILRISSNIARQKVFSTCSSHLAVVCTYYVTLVAIYIIPSKQYSMNMYKILSFLNTVMTPLFNPIIYSLKNKEIRTTVSKLMLRSLF